MKAKVKTQFKMKANLILFIFSSFDQIYIFCNFQNPKSASGKIIKIYIFLINVKKRNIKCVKKNLKQPYLGKCTETGRNS